MRKCAPLGDLAPTAVTYGGSGVFLVGILTNQQFYAAQVDHDGADH